MEILEVWRKDAATFRKYGAVAVAEVIEAMCAQLEAHIRERELEALTIDEAAQESGYSYSAIQKMVSSGELENVGRKHAPRVRRGDLPRKGRKVEDAPSIVDALIAGL